MVDVGWCDSCDGYSRMKDRISLAKDDYMVLAYQSEHRAYTGMSMARCYSLLDAESFATAAFRNGWDVVEIRDHTGDLVRQMEVKND